MEALDAATLARIQFAATALFHFLFVPLSIGFGLILAILRRRRRTARATRTTRRCAQFWLRLFRGDVRRGGGDRHHHRVLSFGTNWADYARFVGDIFGAPPGRRGPARVLPRVGASWASSSSARKQRVVAGSIMATGWLVWFGSMPVGAVDSSSPTRGCRRPRATRSSRPRRARREKAVMTSFLEAASQPLDPPPLRPHGHRPAHHGRARVRRRSAPTTCSRTATTPSGASSCASAPSPASCRPCS